MAWSKSAKADILTPQAIKNATYLATEQNDHCAMHSKNNIDLWSVIVAQTLNALF